MELKNNTEISKLVSQIIELVKPLKIIVFGSYCRGDNILDSDVDLLIIMAEGSHKRKTAQFIYRSIENVIIPFDIIVATQDIIDKHKEDRGYVYYSALHEGIVVYAA